jgi:hypothetical protein
MPSNSDSVYEKGAFEEKAKVRGVVLSALWCADDSEERYGRWSALQRLLNAFVGRFTFFGKESKMMKHFTAY